MLLIALIIFFLGVSRVEASEGIQVKQNFEYKFDTYSDARVEQNLFFTNIDDEIYSKGYKLTLKNLKPMNIKAWDGDGNVLKNVIRKTDEVEVELLFNKPALGSGRTKEVTIIYELSKFGVKKGNTVEVEIPMNIFYGLIKIEVPINWGKLAWFNIKPKLITNFGNMTQLYFEDQKDRINIAFGNFHLFDVKIVYNLTNNTKNNLDTEIAIPAERETQEVVILKLEPEAESIRKDDNGNWLLKYSLKPGETKMIQLEEQIKTYSLASKSFGVIDEKNISVNIAKEEVKKKFDNVEAKINLPNFFRKQKLRIVNKNPNTVEEGIFEIREIEWKYQVKEMLPGETIEIEKPQMPWYYHLLPKYRTINMYLTHDDGEKLIKVKNPNYYLELLLLTSLVLTTISVGSIILVEK